MNFELTLERQMLQDSLRRLLLDLAEVDTTERWSALAEMGVIDALFTEADGGLGGAGFDVALIFEELGRAGAAEPLLDTAILAGGLLARSGSQAHGELVTALMNGHVQLAFAHTEPASRYDLSRVETTATLTDGKYVLNGRKAVVVNAPAADHLIVSARTGETTCDQKGISLFCIATSAEGVAMQSYPLVGGGQAAEITLKEVSVDASCMTDQEGTAYDLIAQANARAILAISAEALGLMEAINELTIQYLKTRRQFGQPIGKFQALQHRMADLAIEIAQARSAVINLAGHVDEMPTVRDKYASAAKYLIGNTARLVAEESIQMHGGIGMTQDYELGHLVKRLVMVDHRFGDTDYHLERFITLTVS